MSDSYGEMVRWEPATPRLRVLRLLVSWVVAAASVAIAPGSFREYLEQTGAAFAVAALIAVLNALLPPVLAALRLPFMLVAGFCWSSLPTRSSSRSQATCSRTMSTWGRSATPSSPPSSCRR